MTAKARYEQAFRGLHDLHLADVGHAVLRFTTEAQQMFRDWMEEIQGEARAGGLPSSLESHLLKMPKTIAGLALIFELVEGGRVAVGEDATARALGWADYLKTHARRLYAAGETMAEDGARLILERRAQLPEPFTARDIHRRNWAGLSDRDAVGAALEVLEASNHCHAVAEPAGTTGGAAVLLLHLAPGLSRSTEMGGWLSALRAREFSRTSRTTDKTDKTFSGEVSSVLSVPGLSVSQKFPPEDASAISLADWQAYFDERAGIREFDGGLPRSEAERLALEDTVAALGPRLRAKRESV